MAGDNNFSVQLDTPDGVIQAPVYNPGPSPLNPILETLSSGIRQFSSDMDERRKAKAKAKEDAEKQREEDARGALFDGMMGAGAEAGDRAVSDPWLGLVTGRQALPQAAPPPANAQPPETANTATPAVSDVIINNAVTSGAVKPEQANEITSDLSVHAEELSNIDSGISQGTLPRTAKTAAVDRVLLEVRSKFPDVDVDVILSFMDKAGIKSPALYELQRELDDQKGADETLRKQRDEALQKGLTILGPGAAAMSQETIVATGWNALQQEAKLAGIEKQLDLTLKQTQITDAERKLANETAATEIQATEYQGIINTLAPFATSLQEILTMMPEAGSNPALEQRFVEVSNIMRAQAGLRIEEVVARVATSGIPNALELSKSIRESLTSYVKTTFLDPIENRDKSTAKVAQLLKDKMGLNSALSYPFIAQMKAAGIDMQLTDTLLSVMDPSTKDRLAKEIAKLNNSNMFSVAGRETALIQMTEVAAILKGDKTLNQLDITPQTAKAMFKTIRDTTAVFTTQIAAGDLTNEDAFLNGQAELVVAAGNLSAATDTRTAVRAMVSLSAASKGGSSLSALGRLINSGSDPEHAQVVGLGTRAAIAKLQQNLVNRGDKTYGFYTVRYNQGTGKWQADFNKSAWEASPQSRGPVGDSMDTKFGINRGAARAQPPIPKEGRDMVAALNYGSNFLVESAKWDENAPKVSPQELRAWYNQGKVPKKVVDELAAQKPDRKRSGDADVMKALNALEKVFTDEGWDFEVPTRPGEDGSAVDARGNVVVRGEGGRRVTIESVETVRAKYSNKPVFKQVVSQARAHGIPEEVALVLAGHEGKFNPNARADAGKGRTAWGPMQVVDAFHDKTALSRYGRKVKDLSPAQNVDLGLFILAENYKSAGNWRDAMAMYHSGVTLEQARKQGRSDGNIRTADYITGLAGAAGIS